MQYGRLPAWVRRLPACFLALDEMQYGRLPACFLAIKTEFDTGQAESSRQSARDTIRSRQAGSLPTQMLASARKWNYALCDGFELVSLPPISANGAGRTMTVNGLTSALSATIIILSLSGATAAQEPSKQQET